VEEQTFSTTHQSPVGEQQPQTTTQPSTVGLEVSSHPFNQVSIVEEEIISTTHHPPVRTLQPPIFLTTTTQTSTVGLEVSSHPSSQVSIVEEEIISTTLQQHVEENPAEPSGEIVSHYHLVLMCYSNTKLSLLL